MDTFKNSQIFPKVHKKQKKKIIKNKLGTLIQQNKIQN